MKVAIVVLNYNGLNLLKIFIPQLIKNCLGLDFYVVDNGSDDDSVNYIINEYPNVKVIINEKNFGYAGGYNKSLNKINAELFICLNNDATFIDKKSVNNIIEVFKKNPEIVAAQPRIINYTNRKIFDYAGASGGFIDLFGYPFCRGRIFTEIEDVTKYCTTREIFWASGCCLVIRKSSFNSVNGFDSSFFAHMEEIDLCWRLKNNNNSNKIVVIGNANVYHLGGATLNYNTVNKNYLNFRNSLVMLIKNLPKKLMFVSLTGRFFTDFIILIVSLITLNFKVVKGIIKAYFFVIMNLINIFRLRSSRNSNFKFYYCKSIFYNFFFKRKKFFSEI